MQLCPVDADEHIHQTDDWCVETRQNHMGTP